MSDKICVRCEVCGLMKRFSRGGVSAVTVANVESFGWTLRVVEGSRYVKVPGRPGVFFGRCRSCPGNVDENPQNAAWVKEFGTGWHRFGKHGAL